jgi:hypothetical protein
MNRSEAKLALRRRAIVLDIGGFRSTDDPHESWFGRVSLAARDEVWPTTNGKPMLALGQVNLTLLPFRPPRLDDIAFIAIFVGPDSLPNSEPNGSNWCLRLYASLANLVPLSPPATVSSLKPFPMRPRIVESDFPCHDDINVELDEDVEETYYDHFENVDGFKLGGWPTLIQSEIYFAPYNKHPAAPEYVFQIDSTEKGEWSWGHGGVGYFGRGTAPGHENEWCCEWQCY